MIFLYYFGNQEKIQYLTDVPVVGPKGEQLCLAGRTSVFWFVVPIAFAKDGYVLGVLPDGMRGKPSWRSPIKRFYPLTEAGLKQYQGNGVLPAQLPPYKVPLYYRISAMALWTWIVVAGLRWMLGS